MKQKYSIFKDSDAGTMTIKEFAELDKGMFSLIFEETYNNDAIQAAIAEGKNALISAIRTPNLYPIAEYVEKIADTIIDKFDDAALAEEPVELLFNDIKLMKQEKKDADAGDDSDDDDDDDDDVEIDDLLDDDSDSDDDDDDDVDAELDDDDDDVDGD